MMKKTIDKKTLIFPLPVLMVGSFDEAQVPNLMAAAWGGICNSEPPAIAISVRKERKTYANIIYNQAFTINIPSVALAKASDYCGIISGNKENKIETCKLSYEKAELINAPIFNEFPISLVCKLIKTVEIGSHTQFIGEILEVLAEESVLDENNMPDIEKVEPLHYDNSSRYYYKAGEKVLKAYTISKKEMLD